MLRVGYYVERPNEGNFIVGCVHLIQLDYLYSGWGASLCFSRLLSSDVSIREFKTIIEKQKQIAILPLNANDGLNMSKVSIFFINLLVRFPWLFLPVKVLYSYLFVPFILPRLDRNR